MGKSPHGVRETVTALDSKGRLKGMQALYSLAVEERRCLLTYTFCAVRFL